MPKIKEWAKDTCYYCSKPICIYWANVSYKSVYIPEEGTQDDVFYHIKCHDKEQAKYARKQPGGVK